MSHGIFADETARRARYWEVYDATGGDTAAAQKAKYQGNVVKQPDPIAPVEHDPRTFRAKTPVDYTKPENNRFLPGTPQEKEDAGPENKFIR